MRLLPDVAPGLLQNTPMVAGPSDADDEVLKQALCSYDEHTRYSRFVEVLRKAQPIMCMHSVCGGGGGGG